MFVLVPVALVVVLVAVIAYIWAARRGQFDDLTTPAIRALQDEPGEARLAGRAPRGGASGAPRAAGAADDDEAGGPPGR